MERKKVKRLWHVDCLMCGTTVNMEAETITSTNQGAVFIKRPDIICGECTSVCVVSLVREEKEVVDGRG